MQCRIAILVGLLFLLLPGASWAALTHVSTTDSPNTTGSGTITMALTVPAGTDRLCTASVQARRSGGIAPANVTSLTFNGSQAFTFIRRDSRNASVAIQTELWYLTAPTVTTANVVATFANASSDRVQALSVTCLAGAGQSNQPDSHAGANGLGTTLSAGITTIADGAWIVDSAFGAASGGLTVGAGQTARTDRVIGTSSNHGVGVSTVNGKATAGSETMDWTQTSNDWVYSTASFSPSGGAEPEPAVPNLVTLSMTYGTDPGTPSSGICSATFLRCTGVGCNAVIAPAIGTVAFPTATFPDTTVQPSTTYGYSGYETDCAGLPSTRHASVYVTTSGTPAPPPPSIISAVADLTGADLVYGTTPPTKIRVVTFTSLRVISAVLHELTDFPGQRFTRTWPKGLQGVCFTPVDENGNANPAPADSGCDNLEFVGPQDTTPPTLDCPTTIALPAGVTEWTFSCDVDKPDTTAKFDIVDTTYALMATEMSQSGLTFSGTQTGLSSAATTLVYVRAELAGLAADEGFPMTTSEVITITVAAAPGDVTPPGDVTTLSGTLLGTSVAFTWDHPILDAVKYQLYQANGACAADSYTPAGLPTAPPFTVSSLPFGVVFCWKMKALDSANNLSTNFSNIVTKTTPAAPDVERPSILEDLKAEVFQNTIRLTWKRGTDNGSGEVRASIEFCLVAVGQDDCANFIALVSERAETVLTPPNLLPGRRYCFRGKNSDETGNTSLEYNEPVCETTTTTGLTAPRPLLPFGTDRPAGATRPATGATRIPRPGS